MKVLRLLECPVCFTLPDSEGIFNCLNGHVLCGKCRPRIRFCPVCREPKIIRSPFCERMAKQAIEEKAKVICKFADFGCDEIMSINKMYDHERMCGFTKPKEITARKICLCILCSGNIHRPVFEREPTLLCKYVDDWTDMLSNEKCCCTLDDECWPPRDSCNCYVCHKNDCICASVCNPYWNAYTTCSHASTCEGHITSGF